jgi:hypothetical protein
MADDYYANYLAELDRLSGRAPAPEPSYYSPEPPAYQPSGQVRDFGDFDARLDALAGGLPGSPYSPAPAPAARQRPEMSDEEAAQVAQALEDYFDERGLTEAERNLVASRAVTSAELNGEPLDLDAAIDDLQAAHTQRSTAEQESAGLPEWKDGDSPAARREQRVQFMTAKAQRQELAERDLQRTEGNDDRAWVREGREPNMDDRQERIAVMFDDMEGAA